MSISVIIPVHNEQKTINETVSRLSDCEIIVTDSNGRTLDAIADDRVIKVFSPKTGRGPQQKHGAKAATGDVLLFLHADTQLPAGWAEMVSECLKTADAGAFSLGIAGKRNAFRIIEFFTNIRCRLTHIPYGDQAIFMTSECYRAVGGFREYPLFEDFAMMQDIKARGLRIKILKAKVITSARRWEKEGALYTTLRNWMIAIMYLCGVSPEKLNAIYRRRNG